MPSAPQKLALLDSGATIGVEYVRRLRPELPTRPVTLANGSSVPGSMYTGPKGIPLCQMISKQEDKQRILPLYWLIDRFCALNSDWTKLITPTEREIDIFMFEDLPHIADAEVDNLLKDLPHEGEQGRSGKIAGINNVMHLRLRISANAVRVDGGASDQFGHLQNVGGLAEGASHPPPPPAANIAAGAEMEARRLHRQRSQRLRDVFEKDCKFEPSCNVRKKIDRYRAMPDEYHKDSDDYLGMDGFKNLQDMKRLGYEPGAPVRLWEWMSGSGRLSATARARAMSHLPPLDYRYGHNLGHWHHQMIALFTLLVFPVEVLWSSPTCTPWSANARQWQPEVRHEQRQQEMLTLQFLGVACFIQLILGRHFVIENPHGSDLFEAHGLKAVAGKENVLDIIYWIFDQCMLGAKSGGKATKKRTKLAASFRFKAEAPQCDGSHTHQLLHGRANGVSRTAAAAVYPKELCTLILNEICGISQEQQLGGSVAEIDVDNLYCLDHVQTTLTKILPELRLLAQHKGGQAWVEIYDTLVAPWAEQALGEQLPVLTYDTNLSRLQTVLLKDASKSCRVQAAARGGHARGGTLVVGLAASS